MVPDPRVMISEKLTGRHRVRVIPRRFMNCLIGPRHILEVEITQVWGWGNPYRHDTTEGTFWRRERRSDRILVIGP